MRLWEKKSTPHLIAHCPWINNMTAQAALACNRPHCTLDGTMSLRNSGDESNQRENTEGRWKWHIFKLKPIIFTNDVCFTSNFSHVHMNPPVVSRRDWICHWNKTTRENARYKQESVCITISVRWWYVRKEEGSEVCLAPRSSSWSAASLLTCLIFSLKNHNEDHRHKHLPLVSHQDIKLHLFSVTAKRITIIIMCDSYFNAWWH